MCVRNGLRNRPSRNKRGERPIRGYAATVWSPTWKALMDNKNVPLVLRVLEKTLTLQAPISRAHIERLRRNHPEESPKEILRRLNRELRAATVSAGAGVGALAAAPAVGTGLALALSGVEAVAFLNASALYVLARAEVYGTPVQDIERRRTLVMAILLGEAGAAQVGKVAERTG